MKIELSKYTRFFLFTILAISLQTVVYAGGNRERSTVNDTTEEMRRLIWTSSDRPEWVDAVPQSTTEIYFTGTSQPYDTAANARDNARENARNQALKYYGEFIERQAIESGSMTGLTSDTFDAFIVREDEIRSYAENVISQVGTDRYYTELYLNSNNQEEYIVYVLCQINRQKAEEDIANFAKNISQRYAAMMTPRTTLKTTLEGYIIVLNALRENTLHRVTAYHDGTAGRVGLYGHVLASINELVNSIEIIAIPNRTIQKPDTLNTVVRFNSTHMSVIGPFDCRVSIHGVNIKAPVVHYTLNNENQFQLPILTTRLEPGMYTVQIELLIQDVSRNIGRNVSGGFSFEVTPLTLVLNNRNEIETGIKRAVDTLAMGLQTPIETRIGLFALTGTDIPTGLSRYLNERVTHYAINNPDRKYRVNRENIEIENNQIAIISGFFTKRNDQVEITIELNTPNGDGDGSQFFIISAEVLAGLGIAIEPENIAILPSEPLIEPQDNHRINIQAFFNSESLTYFHRDELGITVMADGNCYFKIIHIDSNNQMTMIYPNSHDTNNYLRANMPRAIFETAKAYLYEPYGAETIIVVASIEQFRNIEQEYVKPLVPATNVSVRTAVRGSRGNENDGEAVYTITILKPHEEYQYGRPENMREMVESLRRDVLSQNGTFEGNEISGVYTVNNIRGSYRISRDAPDKIKFAIYYLDNYNNGMRAGLQTRSRGFSFSFTRPANMTQAIQEVRAEIEESGGTFSGNEQQGNFRAEGITGQYRVSELVNVTITEKPFMIPNSLIEREVRNYFGGR